MVRADMIPFRSMALIGVVFVLVASTLVFAQDQKRGAAPRGPTVATKPQLFRMQPPEPPKQEPAADPNFAPLLQQFTQQYRPVLRAELHLVRTVCGLTNDQRRKIHQAGETALKESATKSAEMQVKMMRGVAAGQMPDMRKSIQDAVSAAVKKHLSADQAARYDAEIEERIANQKRVAVRNSVAMLDEELCLSADQRERISESMSAHWSDNWIQSIELFQYGRQFLFPIPDQCILPFLNETQKAVWQGNRETRQNFFGGAFFGGVALDNEPLDDPEPAAPEAVQPPAAEPPRPARP